MGDAEALCPETMIFFRGVSDGVEVVRIVQAERDLIEVQPDKTVFRFGNNFLGDKDNILIGERDVSRLDSVYNQLGQVITGANERESGERNDLEGIGHDSHKSQKDDGTIIPQN